jgi:hypothetical protein
MGRFSFLVFIFFISLSLLWGQAGREQDADEDAPTVSEVQEPSNTPNPFPLGPMLITTIQGTVSWRPDWTVAMPPDAFRVSSGQPVSITLSLEEQEYRIRWNNKGSLAEFPFLLQGQFVQVEILFDASNNMKGLLVRSADEVPWQIDFIGEKGAPLSIARITQGESVSFAALRYDPTLIAETWYDQEGKPLADFTSLSRYTGENLQTLTLTSRYTEEEATDWYYYDSFGNISEINGSGGVFSVLYSREQYPRYWKRQPLEAAESGITEPLEKYTLQWDEQGFLLRIAETSEGKEDRSDLHYEYTLDNRGNWIERREIRMIQQLGVLTSSPGLIVKRVISYGTGK